MAPEEPASPPPSPPAPPVRYAVTAPGPVSGGVMGIGFANGQAVITDAARHARAMAWFRAQPDYVVVQIDDGEPAPVEDDVEPEAPGDAEDADDEAADEAAGDPEEGPEWA